MGPELLKNIVTELDELLRGGIVSRIHQPDEREIVLKIFVRGRDERLLISTHPRFSRMHLTEREIVNPPAPPRFCAFLRSRILNARIDGFSLREGERIARVLLARKKDDEAEPTALVAELTGKSGNIILVDSNDIVLDALRYFPPETSQRAVAPGVELVPLPPPPARPCEEAVSRDGFSSWNRAVDAHYSRLVDEEEAGLERNRLKRAIQDAEKKARKKLENLEGDRKKALEEAGCASLGNLLVANYKKLRKGMEEIEAEDYAFYPPRTVKVRLDPKADPKQNVEKYFRRARKARTALGLLEERIPKVEQEIEYAGALIYELEACRTAEDLLFLREELAKEGYIRGMEEKTAAKAPEPQRAEPIRRFKSLEGGFEILCGKSGPGNDLIVKKYARNEDIWFHASRIPGSHVLIKVAGRKNELTKKTIEEAAALAAWHSKAQAASKVEVVYAEAGNVKKPRGTKPGMVTVKEYKTMLVRPRPMEDKVEGDAE